MIFLSRHVTNTSSTSLLSSPTWPNNTENFCFDQNKRSLLAVIASSTENIKLFIEHNDQL